MQFYTSSNPTKVFVRLDPNETERFKTGDKDFREDTICKAQMFADRKGREKFRIEGATEADAILFEGEI